ncbi:hypothetical protein TNCV_732761 [Trichonephila clavipes]|nr:hypothetical protein TNCV_732761 [Trichonephila clavipes]
MCKRGFIDFNVDTSTPFSCITPIDSYNHVAFREELLTSTSKHSSHPELLRQLALEPQYPCGQSDGLVTRMLCVSLSPSTTEDTSCREADTCKICHDSKSSRW